LTPLGEKNLDIASLFMDVILSGAKNLVF
jgi:hypothetical protein